MRVGVGASVKSTFKSLGGGARLGAALIATTVVILIPSVASAAWTRAESDRFVVHGEGDPRAIRDYAVKLTIYDEVLRLLFPPPKGVPAPQKVDVYLVRGHEGLSRVWPSVPQAVGGFYEALPSGIFAVAETGAVGLKPNTVLFHEYAHHFMKENFPAAYPAWFVEGWAEYVSTIDIKPSGIIVGAGEEGRVAWLNYGDWTPLRQLLTDRPLQGQWEEQAHFYPESWALVHYMEDTPERRAQLHMALQAIASGADPVKAVESATGLSMADLTHRLQTYGTMMELRVKTSAVDMAPKVEVSTLPPSADDLLLDKVRLEMPLPVKRDDRFLAEVRRLAAKYPGDRLADLVLARVEFAYGDAAAGQAIVDRRLASDPNDADFLRVKGESLLLAGNRDEAHRLEKFRAARAPLIKAYGLEKDDFRILYDYVESRSVEPDYPDDNDLNALLAANSLAPAVADISVSIGEVLIRKGRRPEANAVLAVVAKDPHGGSLGVRARALIAGKSEADAKKAAELAEKSHKD